MTYKFCIPKGSEIKKKKGDPQQRCVFIEFNSGSRPKSLATFCPILDLAIVPC